ncbi:MAG: hypothetical protein WBW04_09555 [Nitrolancea sp.]
MNSVMICYLLCCFALLMLLVACSSKASPTVVPTPQLPDTLELKSALLSASDIGTGWVLQTVDDKNGVLDLPCGNTPPDTRYVRVTEIFTQDTTRSRLSETIAAFHQGKATEWMDDAQAGTGCTPLDGTDPHGTPIATTVEPLTLEPLGDQSFGYRMTTNYAGVSYVSELAFIRQDDVILEVGESINADSENDQMNSLEQQALDKLQANPF